ncbi:MAG TPA: sigma-70 family RNA polymerase sigma factor [Proteobacteria bacterium]|nr:RNA polymerase sigma factor RpoH [bacterium BMS3Abin14]HDL54204.1 sigma-70 family RNA polymerase sigma factor [Pseudomonadota bacterium]
MAEKKPRRKKAAGRKAVKPVKSVEILPSDEGLKKKTSVRKGSTVSSRPVRYDPIAAFYNDIRNYPVLSREEEKALAVRYLKENDIDAAYSLVTSNLKLVIKIAMEYRRLWKEIIDLVQEGNVGLMHAVKKYDPYRGVRFSSYAAWWIRAYIIRYIMNNTRMVKLGTTQAQRTLYFQMGKERERLRKMGIEPDTKALAKSLKVRESEVEEMTQRLSGGDVSMDAVRGDAESGFTMLDALPSPEPGADEIVADVQARTIYLEKLSEFVAALTDRDRKIFTSRWMRDDPYTLQEIGDKLGITRERVRQLEARIMKNLRAYLEKEGLQGADFFN